MSTREPHYAVQFAARYGSPTADYLNAMTAIARLDELLDDVKALKDQFDIVMPEDTRWCPWVGAEVVSYYSVGFVTCLEWHARARLVDLLTFFPSAAKSEDLKVLRDKVILEMLATNVTVASIVGAATNISSFEDYMGVFSRLFSTVDPDLDAFKAIKAERPGTGGPWIQAGEIDDLKELYRFRNSLTHEIGIHRIGHWNVRDRWDPTEAIRMGDLVHRTIHALETCVSEKMPPGFPNVLNSDGLPVSEWKRLEKELPVLEEKIRVMAAEVTGEKSDVNWGPARAAAADYIAKEILFLDESHMLHNRYVEMREPLKVALIKSRHFYLTSIMKMMSSVWMLDETGDSN